MLRFLVCGILAASMAGPVAASEQQPTFRGRSDIVRVYVTVTDRDGRLATTLKQDDFEVRDEGKPQPIVLFDNTPQPIRLIVMLDVSGSMEGNLELLRAASDQLFARLSPTDRVRLGTFGADIEISESFTSDPQEMRAALPDHIPSEVPTPLWQAMEEAMDGFEDTGAERPVILVLSDGQDSGPRGFGRYDYSQAGTIDRARRDDVMIYAVGMRSRGQRRMQPGIGPGSLRAMVTDDMPDPGLAKVAEETGGGYTEIRYGEDLGAAFARVVDELHSQYLLGFVPPKRDGKVHDVDVRVSERGLKPRARKSYVAPRERSSSP
jgi:Ca-activated chloride channel homolog